MLRLNLFMICCLGTLAIVRADDRPNIILFIADDISWNDFGCYGNPAARTPHVDRLARSGIHFTEAYLTASSCSPSRASIITGRYSHNSGKAAELHLEILFSACLLRNISAISGGPWADYELLGQRCMSLIEMN